MTRMHLGLSILALGAIALSGCQGSDGRDRVAVVGSSTLFPFSAAAAEQFSARGRFKTPRVESTGTGGGFSIFCRGLGPSFPDISNASRRIKKGEYETCQKNGVTDIVEVKIGYDGIVIANSKAATPVNLTKLEIYQALAKDIYDPVKKAFVPNPYTRWSQINPNLPDIRIDVMGPPPTSGTRDAFAELVMAKGAQEVPELKALKEEDDKAFQKRAQTLREDGAWKDSGENDSLIVQALTRSPEQFGVFGFSSFEENMDRLQAAPIGGVIPTAEAIISGDYGASRSLYFYVKKANVGVVPGLQEFAMELLSDHAAGLRGYLRARGMVPLHPEERAANFEVTRTLPVMKPPEK
ncbi:phosphate-binding protein PstS [Candidatus Phycosocius bacilliformis]|uniref:Phosphate-binding protein PstS n=1 Tax=Candidatus Phycosocius bacilliformis TaxID=1445552 RepID=A0A2P2E727_9PROT|nr:substrate-binding domain-containing protein [Candidatus Phycosocius bacilliformis]GBF56875.1 phosphate-binding protein PstS [Candidatus Phycosocius bacilliformis]